MMNEVLEMIFKNLGEWTFVADVEEIVGKERAQAMVDDLVNKGFVKYCGCDCGGFMTTDKAHKHLKSLTQPETAVWTTQDGLKIRVTHMSNEHLVNAINWLIIEQEVGPEDNFSDLTDEYQGIMIGTWVKILSQELYNRIPK